MEAPVERWRPPLLALAALCLAGVGALTQASGAEPASPEVHADRRVTFRFRAPNAKEVLLALEGARDRAMAKDAGGVWAVTTEPLEPDDYGYSFLADGVTLIDPANPVLQPNLLKTQSVVHVPGPSSLPWETNDVPHGVVHRHWYRSALVGDDREYDVYTPPGYAAGDRLYPVLYLLHGFSDDTSAWTAVGRAHVILDNLIAAGRARPMVVVMPCGYGAPEILAHAYHDTDLRPRNAERFRRTLVEEVLPAVEAAYRVARDRESRAIAGLSMGGAQALLVGLSELGRFAWIGGFSSAVLDDPATSFPDVSAEANDRIRLLWIACGKQDHLLADHRRTAAWLRDRGIRHTAVETEGDHTWMVWRRNLASFAALLFR